MTYIEIQALRKEAADVGKINAANAALTDKRFANTSYGKTFLDMPAPQELLYHGLGAASGGVLGYLLSRTLHKKPSGLLRALYTIGGAGVGGIAPYYLLRAGKDSNGMTAADRLRLQNAWANAPKEMQERRNMYEGIEPSKQPTVFDEITGAALLHPITLGATSGAIIDAARYGHEASRAQRLNNQPTKEVSVTDVDANNNPVGNKHVTYEKPGKIQPPKFLPGKMDFKKAPAASVYDTARRGAFTLGGTAAGIITALLRHNLNKQRIVEPISSEELNKIFD